jgi:hypothetical protein
VDEQLRVLHLEDNESDPRMKIVTTLPRPYSAETLLETMGRVLENA